MFELGVTLKLISALAALAWAGWVVASGKRSALYVSWGAFSLCMGLYMIADALGDQLGAWRPFFVMFSSGTCSLIWLFTRSLFRIDPQIGRFELILVGGIIAPSVIRFCISLVGGLMDLPPDALAPALEIIWRTQTLLSSTALMLTIWEVMRQWPDKDQTGERIVRAVYGGLFFGMVVLNMAVLEVPPFTQMPGLSMLLEGLCAVAIYVMFTFVLRYRQAHPLRPHKPAPPATDDDVALGGRLTALLDREHLYLNPDLTLAMLANALGEPPNKVSRAITAGLKAANVNQLINARRIARAKTVLADPAQDDMTILHVALDSGFNSIGPFNRAFKTQTGATPRQFRQARTHMTDALPAE